MVFLVNLSQLDQKIDTNGLKFGLDYSQMKKYKQPSTPRFCPVVTRLQLQAQPRKTGDSTASLYAAIFTAATLQNQKTETYLAENGQPFSTSPTTLWRPGAPPLFGLARAGVELFRAARR
ncbi:hypothetical protein CHH28_15825 [Bacterioplanes sanyensis]|uniref:Uncharacterized protein n=1 Tax=Bacterioplanes sanyensis TaxID=1249553 RepID=A0A222FNU0_9GAMM|nr:hypothetical protein CHH28_15825 [Bacterioplanes sanyensis]